MFSQAVLVGMTAISVASAAYPPGFVVSKLASSCSAWPQYDASSGEAGPWTVLITKSDNGTLDNHSMEPIFATDSNDNIVFGRMIVHDKIGLASTPFRCLDGHGIQSYVPTKNNVSHNNGPGGGIDYMWEDIKIILDPAWPSQHYLLYTLDNTTDPTARDVEAYNVTIDGQQLPGVYLGTNNSVRWSFWQDEGLNGDPWIARLLEDGFAGENPPDYQNRYEISGLMKVAV